MSFRFALFSPLGRSLRKQPKHLLFTSNMVQRKFSAAPVRGANSVKPPYSVDTSVGPMYRYQKALPRLPVPALADTLNLYLKSVEPLITSEQYAETKKAVQEFKKPGGIGEELQKRLLEKASRPDVVNWLEDWWNDLAYFGYRDPVVVYVSYFYAYKDDKLRKDPATRAAAIVTAALQFRDWVINEQLEPEYSKGLPLDMESNKYMFHACRIPNKPSDFEKVYDPHSNEHIVIIRNNKFYTLEFIREGKQLSTAELESQIRKIYDLAGYSKDPAIGALTCENRDIWTEVRKTLIATDPKNEKSLQKIESAAFALCLDDTSPVTRDEISKACWVGNGRNRFNDKSLQFIVFENGKAGFMGEHSSMDGMPTCRLNHSVCEVLTKNKVDHGSTNVRSDLPMPEKLEFTINKEIFGAIRTAEQNFDSLVAKHDLRVLSYEGYGKEVIKKLGFSPDAYVQMMIQLAYYKMYGTSKATYESAQTRKFTHGRTEVCRSTSVDSVKWVKFMEDPNASIETKAGLGRQAIEAHVKYMSAAVEGRGCDRHLLGLRLSLKPEEPKPSIFTDPAYAISTHWTLSTSQLSSEYFDGYGWGEVVPDGYGIAYMINSRTLNFNIVSMHLQNDKMWHYLREAADEMRDVFELAQAKREVSAKL
ncbi:hypothetical protein G9A89_013788 [Geosiphon pyriformis]|nr:hypothetical protein G9A89_013788 [Geosiphon pyriformis]